MIRLTSTDGDYVFVNPNMVTSISQSENESIVWSADGKCHIVKENAEIVSAALGWQPEPVATPDRPKTMTADELRVGDEIGWDAYRIKIQRIYPDGGLISLESLHRKYPSVLDLDVATELLSRGVQVYRDGKLISGWPVESPPAYVISDPVMTYEEVLQSANRNIKRADELEAEVRRLDNILDCWIKVANKYASGNDGPMLVNNYEEFEDWIESVIETSYHEQSKVKAWKDAASIDLVQDPDEPSPPCKTPEELVERIKSLFGWATRAEKRAEEAKAELDEWEVVANRIAPSHQCVRPSDIERKYNDLRGRTQEVPPLDPWRVLRTAELAAERKLKNADDFEYSFWRILKESLWSACNRSPKDNSSYPVNQTK